MASYHLSVQIVGRSPLRGGRSGKPRNVVAMAAYRAGQALTDESSGRVADFSGRRGVAHTEIMAPEGSAAWLRDRERLWNTVEKMEVRKDAQLAREINLALPHELDDAGRLDLVRSFVAEQFVALGMVADIAIHQPVPEKGDDVRNHHAHILLTLRQATADGLRRVKTREWNSDSLLKAWRAAFAVAQNRALAQANRRERVDHRTLKEQWQEAFAAGHRQKAAELDRQPEIHMGPRARQLSARAERDGYEPRSTRRTRPTARPSGGSFKSSPDREKRERLIDYPRIDLRRTRAKFIEELVSGQQRRTRERADHYEARQARIRDKGARAERARRQLEADRKGQGALMRAQQELLRKRAAQARALNAEIEKLLAGFSLSRQRGSRRLEELLSLSRLFGRPRARGRTRTWFE